MKKSFTANNVVIYRMSQKHSDFKMGLVLKNIALKKVWKIAEKAGSEFCFDYTDLAEKDTYKFYVSDEAFRLFDKEHKKPLMKALNAYFKAQKAENA